MNWSKVKTILIALFLVINVILAGINFFRWNREESISKKTVGNVIKVLENYNVRIEEDLISKEVPELKNLVVRNIIGTEAEFLGGILGRSYWKEDNRFSSGDKSVTIEGNRFVIKEKRAMESLGDAEKWLNDNGIDLSRTMKEEKVGEFVFKTIYEGLEVFESRIYVYTDGEYAVAEGFFLEVSSEEKKQKEARRITSVLPLLIKDGCRDCEIVEISTGYMCDISGSERFSEATASPVYKILTSDGKEYYYSAYM